MEQELNELNGINRKLKALVEFGQAVTSGIRLREDEVLELIYSQASRLMDTDNMYIALYDEATDIVRFPLAFVDGWRVDVGTERGWQPRRGGRGKTEEIIRTRKPLFHATKEEAEAWYAQPGHEEYVGAALPSWLGVPMMVGERVLGVIATYHPTRDYVYSGDDLVILQAMANQAAIALDNAHMFYDVTRRLEGLVNFGQMVTSGIRLREDEILELIHSQASRLMDTDNMYIALYDEATDTVRFGLALMEGRRVDAETEEGWQPRRVGKGRTEEIIRNKEPIFISTKAEAEAWYDEKPEREDYLRDAKGARREMLPSWLGVPMMVGERVLGVIATYHPTRDYVYSGDDLAILQVMASQAAIALDNAHMFYDVNRRLEGLVDFGQAVTSGIRLREDEVLELIYSQASRLMDTDNMYIALYDEVTDTVRFGLALVGGKRADVETDELWKPRKAGKGRTEEIIRTKKPIFHATKEEAVAWYAQPEYEDYWAGKSKIVFPSWLGVPMIVGEKVSGVIATYHPTRDYVYSGDDLAILQAMANQAAIALDNAHMFYDVNRRLEGLVDFGQMVTSGIRLREDEVLELIYSQASRLMDTDNMYIALYDEATDTVRFPLAFVDGWRVDVGTERGWQPRRGGRGKTEEIIRTGKPLFHATRAEAEAWYAQPEHREYIGRLFGSWLGVPMIVGERVLGVIATYHPIRDYVYTSDDLAILQAMANQAAIALDNVASYSQAEKRRSQLETVREVVNVITTELEPQACMERILAETMELLGAHYATIQLIDEATNELVIHAQRGMEGARLASELYRIKIGEGVTGLAAYEKRTIRVGNVEDAGYYLDYVVEGTRSAMATPLIEHGKVIGVLNVEDPRENAFDQDDENLFELLAEQVVIAVQNARRVEASREEQERLAEAERFEYLGLLAGGVAHRVGSKGGLVRLHVNNLRKLVPPEADDVHAVLDKVERDNEYLIELSDALFKPANAAETPIGPVDVNQLLNQAIRRAGIPSDIVISFDEGDVPRVNGNRWLVDVFVELISNAVRAMSETEEKKLTIRSQLIDGNSVAIVFEDTGCGIAPEEMSRVFNIFYTRTRSEETPSRGGYGLWYSKSIVTRMGGDLQIESEVGKGTKCTVLLSAAR